MRAYLASPRRRRRAAGVGFVLVALAAAFAVAWLGRGGGLDTTPSAATPGPAPATPVVAAGAEAPFTNAVRAAVLPVAARFVATAVDRKRLDEAWTLVRPQLKEGYTLERWRTGEIPVVPYPVGSAEWDVQYSLRNEVGLYVLLRPRPGEDVQPTTFILVLARDRPGEAWLVSEWVPAATPAARGSSSAPRGGGGALPAVDPGGAFDQGNLSPLFLVLPVAGTTGVVLAGAAFFLLRGWRRNRRAAAAYSSRELPPLPERYTSSS